jgi:hypothetical protein
LLSVALLRAPGLILLSLLVGLLPGPPSLLAAPPLVLLLAAPPLGPRILLIGVVLVRVLLVGHVLIGQDLDELVLDGLVLLDQLANLAFGVPRAPGFVLVLIVVGFGPYGHG